MDEKEKEIERLKDEIRYLKRIMRNKGIFVYTGKNGKSVWL